MDHSHHRWLDRNWRVWTQQPAEQCRQHRSDLVHDVGRQQPVRRHRERQICRRRGDLHHRQSAESADVLHQRRRQSHGVQLRRHQFLLAAVPGKVRNLCQEWLSRISQLRRQWRLGRLDLELRPVRRQRQQPEHARSGDPVERHHRRRHTFVVRVLRISDFQRRLHLRPGADRQQHRGHSSAPTLLLRSTTPSSTPATAPARRHSRSSSRRDSAPTTRPASSTTHSIRSIATRKARFRRTRQSPCASARCIPAASGV